ncbi:hypothetical protein E0494_10745 [Marinilabiliaceae bacterium JC040]|nr:hypothetical protein [Marinilabiliaceae bacterium JC040]
MIMTTKQLGGKLVMVCLLLSILILQSCSKGRVKVRGLSLEQKEIKLLVGNTTELTPVFSPKDATNKNIIWASTNDKIAKVSEKGLVEAVSKGSATISAKSFEGDFVCTCIVKVDEIQVKLEKLSFKTEATSVSVSGKLELKALFKPLNATNKKVTWASSKPEIATVVSKTSDKSGEVIGEILGKSLGETTITATAEDGGLIASCKLTVIPLKAKSIHFNNEKLVYGLNTVSQLRVVFEPERATNQNVKWTSSNPAVLTIDEEGIVKTLQVGVSKISAVSVDGNFLAECSIEVIEQFFDSFEMFDYSNKYWKLFKLGEVPVSNPTGWGRYFWNGDAAYLNPGKTGRYGLLSYSYVNRDKGYNADNWVVSSKISITDKYNEMSFWIRSVDKTYKEAYEVYVCDKATYEDHNDFKRIQEPLPASGEWEQISIKLSDYIGKDIYVAIRHHDYNKFVINLDDILLPPLSKNPSPASLVEPSEFFYGKDVLENNFSR